MFRKYLGGDITRIEQEALNKEVQANPYVQDAKEGLDQLSGVNKVESLTNLESRLKTRIQKENPRRELTWLSAAAGIAVLVAATFLIWNSFENKTNVAQAESTINEEKSAADNNTNERETINDQEIDFNINTNEKGTKNDQEVDFNITVFGQGTVADNTVNTEDIIVAEQNEKINQPKTITVTKQERKDIPSSSERGALNQTNTTDTYYIDGVKVEGNLIPESEDSTPSSTQASPAQIAAQESKTDNTIENKKDLQKDIEETEESLVIASSDAIITKDQDLLSSSKVRKAKSASPESSVIPELKTVTGFVKDENGELLIGVSVYDIQNNIGTITNIDGNFTLDVPIDAQEFTISYTGYENLIVKIPENNEIIAYLNQGNTVLSEVAVTGLGSAKDENKSYEASAPINGNSTFKKYIKENLTYPSQATNAGIRGKVVLLFNVDSTGSPIDIEIKKSLGYGCDEEAIRLLRDGPKWTQGTIAKKNTISIKFK